MDQNPTSARKLLYATSGTPGKRRRTVKKIKNTCSFESLCTVVDDIKNPSNFLYSYFFGNPLPKSYDDLGRLPINKFVVAADDVINEINWSIVGLRYFKKEIQLFIQYSRIVDNSILIGEYDYADKYLTKIENEICFSIWSLERRFILLEQSKSAEENKTFLSSLNENNKGFFVKTLAFHISNKSEKNFSVLKYNADVRNLLAKVTGNLAEANRHYYYFKLNYFEYVYSDYNNILAFESFNSIVDRYLTLIRVLKLLSVDTSTDEKGRLFIKSRVQYLLKHFDDSDLYTLAVTLEPGCIPNFTKRNLDVRIYDYYISGLYKEAVELIRETIKEHPNVFEYYVLLVYASLYSGEPLVTNSESSFQENILVELYNYIGKISSPYDSYVNLSRICKTLSSFSVQDSLHAFLQKEFGIDEEWKGYNLLSLQHNNPYLVEYFNIYGDKLEALAFLREISNTQVNSTTVQLLCEQIEDGGKNDLIGLYLFKNREQIERATIHQINGDYSSAIEILEGLISSESQPAPVYEICIRNLFQCYVDSGNIDRAIALYVNSYLTSKYIVHKINCEGVFSLIRKNKFRNVSSTIELPLIYTINNADENEIHIAYERFLQSQNATRPSNLFERLNEYEKNKIVFFLHQTCTIDLFKHSIFISGSKDGYSERISICRQLLVIDKENEQTYKNELDSLTESLIIQEGLQQLDESKIYVNEQGLINTELKEYEGLYIRYKTIANILKDDSKQLVFLAKDGILATLEKSDNDDIHDQKNKISAHPLKDFFKEIFDVVANKFLYSKFGIAAYLSTRIRHGVLLGEIRPIFEKYNLISQKDTFKGNYCSIPYWTNRYSNLSAFEHSCLQTELAMLSENIDNLIFSLIKDNLQIRSNSENNEGWLNYDFDDTQMVLYALSLKSTKSYNDFIKKIMEILWLRTDENLKLIRERLQKEFKSKFVETINVFNSNLKSKLPLAYMPEIYTSSLVCITDVQNAIDKIASWFNRSGSQTSDFHIEKIINIVVENVNHSYQIKQLALTKNIESNIYIKGEYYSHIADLLRIFFDNALKHSNATETLIDTEITVRQFDDKLLIDIANHSPAIENIAKLPKLQDNEIHTEKLSTEGKSGFYKAQKILTSDLKNELQSIKFSFDTNNNRFLVSFILNVNNLKV